MNNISFYASLLVVGILTTHMSVQGHLLSGPNNTDACLGDTVQLNCSTNLPYIIQWMFGYPRTPESKVINEPTSDGKGYIRRFFAERFSVIKSGDGFHNLYILNVTFADSGIYACIDDQGFGLSDGRWSVASLNVTECTHSTVATSNFKESRTVLATAIVVPIFVSLIILVVGVALCWFLRRRRQLRESQNKSMESIKRTESDLQQDLQLLTDEERENARSFLGNTRLHGVIREVGPISGLTVLDNQLFVVRADSTQVVVYDTSSLTHSRRIPITGSLDLHAIVASPRDNCLYIGDTKRCAVYRYNLLSKDISRWDVDGGCFSLSLASNHNVLVTRWDSRLIKEYTPDGTLVREISLDSSMKYPMHSVQLSTDQFIVCHGLLESLYRVCIVDTSGRIIKSYGGSKGSGVGQLNTPRHLAVDRHGNVLVADRNNNRVVRLSPSLNHVGYIPLLSRPCALHLDLLTRRLYIGENYTGRVFVLTV